MAAEVVEHGVVRAGLEPVVVDADDADRLGRVAPVVGAHPAQRVDELLGVPNAPGVLIQEPARVAVPGSHVVVELATLRPVQLEGECAEPQGLHQPPQQPKSHRKELVGESRSLAEAHHPGAVHNGPERLEVVERGVGIERGNRDRAVPDPREPLGVPGRRDGGVGDHVARAYILKCA
jgi:hypothetical protein